MFGPRVCRTADLQCVMFGSCIFELVKYCFFGYGSDDTYFVNQLGKN